MVVMWVVPASAEIMPQYMRTEEFNVDVVVAEDNTLSITEEISVDFLTSRHGIYRYIPYILEFDHMVGDERYTKRMRAAITDVYVSGAEYAVETDGDFTLITIGDEDTPACQVDKFTIAEDTIFRKTQLNGGGPGNICLSGITNLLYGNFRCIVFRLCGFIRIASRKCQNQTQ